MSKFGVINKKAELEINKDRFTNEIREVVKGASTKTVEEKRTQALQKYLEQEEGQHTKDNIAKGNDLHVLFESLNEFNMPFKRIYTERNWQFTYLAKLGALLLIEAEAETDEAFIAKINELKKMALRPKDRAMLDFDV